MKRLISITCLILLPSVIFSQTQMSDSGKDLDRGHKIRLSLLIPGISVETGISKKITLFTEIGSGFSLIVTDNESQFWLSMMYSSIDQDQSGFYYKFFPFVKIEERLYYNIDRRKTANKPVNNFTGNYISNYNAYILNEMFISGFTWGLQRNSKRFYFNLNLGVGVSFKNKFGTDTNIEVAPAIINDIKLGLLLN